LLVGAALAVAFLPFTLLYGDVQVAATAALALIAACSVASVLELALPWLLAGLGRDPRPVQDRWRPSSKIWCRSASPSSRECADRLT
jgi:hypothetical protein